MKKCYECGKELKFWQGYRHPVLGKNILICRKCLDDTEESIVKFRNFILKQFKKDKKKHIFNNSIIKLRQMVHHIGHKM